MDKDTERSTLASIQLQNERVRVVGEVGFMVLEKRSGDGRGKIGEEAELDDGDASKAPRRQSPIAIRRR